MFDTCIETAAALPGRRRMAGYVDLHPQTRPYADALAEGLSGPRKSIPYWYLYDARGSALFDRITELTEYYPTRTETQILTGAAAEIAGRIGPEATIYEPGAGSAVKVRILLDALERPAGYVPIDISGAHLLAAADALQAAYPALDVTAVCADHGRPFPLPPASADGRRVGFYPGSSIGNLQPEEARGFLAAWADRLGDGSAMVVGVDLQKDIATLERAYDDAAGVTAAFTLNLLTRANREAGADFDLDAFRHEARWDPARGCIEINLVSLRNQVVRTADQNVAFADGERVHVEDSYKHTTVSFTALAEAAGWRPTATWTDPQRWFSVWFLER
jgi:dimethylhistidine N-methyltransferase